MDSVSGFKPPAQYDEAEFAATPPLEDQCDDIKESHSLARRYPPLSRVDTICCRNGEITSVHGTGKLFKDGEIIEVHPSVGIRKVGSSQKIEADITALGKVVIQQQAIRGCTAATAAMLIVDHGGEPSTRILRMRNLGTAENIRRDLRRANLRPILTIVSGDQNQRLKQLRSAIEAHGSANISIDGELGGHDLVVDQIHPDLSKVTLRCPYHGWQITVTAEAFTLRFRGGTIIQAEKMPQLEQKEPQVPSSAHAS